MLACMHGRGGVYNKAFGDSIGKAAPGKVLDISPYFVWNDPGFLVNNLRRKIFWEEKILWTLKAAFVAAFLSVFLVVAGAWHFHWGASISLEAVRLTCQRSGILERDVLVQKWQSVSPPNKSLPRFPSRPAMSIIQSPDPADWMIWTPSQIKHHYS